MPAGKTEFAVTEGGKKLTFGFKTKWDCTIPSKNKGTDQLYSNCSADLPFVFCIGKILFSHFVIGTCCNHKQVSYVAEILYLGL